MQESKLYVGNLAYSITEDQLQKLFSEYGEVKSVKVYRRQRFWICRNGQCRRS